MRQTVIYFIAAALARAALRWGDGNHAKAAEAIGRDILIRLVRRVGRWLVLLPAVSGFERPDGVVINLSYYAFPFFADVARVAPSPHWQTLMRDGVSLIAEGRFGAWELPPDWLLLSGANDQQPAPGCGRRRETGGDFAGQAAFGTGALGPLRPPPSQYASGVGLSAQYKTDWAAVDIGTSPIGFQQQNILGGIEFSPEIGDGIRLRVTGERRAVTDSVLSYAGTKDSTGSAWGGVTRLRGHGQIEVTKGLFSAYAGGGYAVLDGTNVEQNHEYEMGAGGTYQVWRQGNDALHLGLDLVYFGYDNNLRFFTVGQGGYFSPQSYFAALIPLRYTSKGEVLDWSLGGSVGYQTYHENNSPVFPNDSGLQNALVAKAGSNPNVAAFYPSKSAAGLVGGAESSIDYHVNKNISIGASTFYQHAGDWSEFRALLTAKYSFIGSIW